MKFTKGTVGGLLVVMGIIFGGIAFVYAQTAADADFDDNGQVGFSDFLSFAGKFGTGRGDVGYEAKYDLDSDGQVDFSDFLAFAGFFGQSAVPNEPPVLERIGDQGVPRGVTLTITLVASDPDEDDLAFRVNGHPAGSSLSGSTFRWTPSSGEGDTHSITFTVDDGRGGTAAETITVRVVAFRFNLIGHQITTELPSFVNVLFQVLDSDNWGVTSLTAGHFEVREDDQVVSPAESAMRVKKWKATPRNYRVKTVLMLDTSTSVKQHLQQIKQAAITLVENMTEQQEIALYEFSETPVLLQDFTSDPGALINAIGEIRLGFPTTNLYGSVIAGTERWTDIYTTNEVQQGFLVMLTDGSDTQGSHTLAEALSARGDKNIYTIGLGDEIDPEVLRQLGNAGYFKLTDVSELTGRFSEIQTEIGLLADSFYQLNYLSPKRGDRNHTLALSVKGNQLNSAIRWRFNSRNFCSVRQGVFVNHFPCSDSDGLQELRIAQGDTVRLRAVTYLGTETPQYIWESSDSEIIAIESDSDDGEMARAVAVGDSGQTATLRVFDRANGLEMRLQAEVLGTSAVTLPGGVSLKMVWVAPGAFQMGSPPSEVNRESDEGPVHEVRIHQGFYFGKFEVTQAQWEAVMASNPSHFTGCGDCPVEQVSWNDAQVFINKLNEMTGSKRYRLPSESEWEYAARAGTTTRYSWGDDIGNNRANCNGCGSQWDGTRTAPVGSFNANAWGLHDMHGNVSEWVQDCWNTSYLGAPPDGTAWMSGNCSVHILRGGAWSGKPWILRSAIRGRGTVERRYYTIGFRIVQTLTP